MYTSVYILDFITLHITNMTKFDVCGIVGYIIISDKLTLIIKHSDPCQSVRVTSWDSTQTTSKLFVYVTLVLYICILYFDVQPFLLHVSIKILLFYKNSLSSLL